MVVAELRRWFERQTTHESPEFERALIDADRQDVLLLIARLDEAERKVRDKERQGPQSNA